MYAPISGATFKFTAGQRKWFKTDGSWMFTVKTRDAPSDNARASARAEIGSP